MHNTPKEKNLCRLVARSTADHGYVHGAGAEVGRGTPAKAGLFMARYKPEAQAKDGEGLTFTCASGLYHTHCAGSTGTVNNPG